MATKTKKGGAGKFFLGALLGGLAGVVAGRQLKSDSAKKSCCCNKKSATAKKAAPATAKKTAAKKASTKK